MTTQYLIHVLIEKGFSVSSSTLAPRFQPEVKLIQITPTCTPLLPHSPHSLHSPPPLFLSLSPCLNGFTWWRSVTSYTCFPSVCQRNAIVVANKIIV